MKTQLVTGPSLNPVTLNEAKAHLNLQSSFTTDDALLNAQILTATEFAENLTHRRLVKQTWKLFLDEWAGSDPNRYFGFGFYLPFGQLQSVTHIKYTDTDEDVTTWSSDDYDVEVYDEPGSIVLAYNTPWPTASLYPTNAIEVQFICGWYQGAAWDDATAYSIGDCVTPGTQTGYVYECTTAGTSGGAEPTFGRTIGGTTADGVGTLVWTCRRAVPSLIKQAILLLVSDMYEWRETVILENAKNFKTAENLLSKKTLYEF